MGQGARDFESERRGWAWDVETHWLLYCLGGMECGLWDFGGEGRVG